MFLGQYQCADAGNNCLSQTVLRGSGARDVVPEMVWHDAVDGKMGLTRGQWVEFGGLLGLPTTYQLRPGERDGMPCWKICFPPVALTANKT